MIQQSHFWVFIKKQKKRNQHLKEILALLFVAPTSYNIQDVKTT